MRLRTDIFVSALLRRVFAQGGFAAVLHKGAEEAGAIFIRQRGRLGGETLYAPAPQSLLDEGPRPDRLFELRLSEAEPGAVDAVLDRELRFDPDCWILELDIAERGDLFALVSPELPHQGSDDVFRR
ncbi:DUF1491 family protein [Rhizobium sp. YIM 134829]|uniref:DUF1491 family protein n=1 Tax=Rhizobium sp. YIM 134829 TaxID=3390453 RepID=UPI0039796CAC